MGDDPSLGPLAPARDDLPALQEAPRPPRLHLVGHSFGAKLVTSMVLGGARPASLTLLLAAFSAFAFAPAVPGFRRPGFYYPVVAERRVDGPIVVLRSDHDMALGIFYRKVTGSGEVDRGADKKAGRLDRVATVGASALGAVGARGVGAPEVAALDQGLDAATSDVPAAEAGSPSPSSDAGFCWSALLKRVFPLRRSPLSALWGPAPHTLAIGLHPGDGLRGAGGLHRAGVGVDLRGQPARCGHGGAYFRLRHPNVIVRP